MTVASLFRLDVHVQPRSSKSQIVGRYRNGIKVRIAAPPVDGAANEALIDLLAKSLRVPRRGVRLVKGASSREKVIEIDDAGAECRLRLEALLAAVDKAAPRR